MKTCVILIASNQVNYEQLSLQQSTKLPRETKMRKGSGFLINAGPTMIVLAFLQDRAQPAFDIALELERRSKGKLIFHQSTLYPLLKKLQKEGLIVSSWELPEGEAPRRIYTLTEKGRAEAKDQVSAWLDYAETIGQVLQGAD
jgi:PadR family transcriptional regulator, regulatory protein PadR